MENKKIQTQDIVYGKVPPQALDLERAVLGVLMCDKNALSEIGDLLSEDVFYKDAHRRIYRAIQRLDSKNQPVDVLMVVEELMASNELMEVGGPYEITRLTNNIDTRVFPSAQEYTQIIIQKAMLRAQITAGGEMVNAALEPGADPFILLDKAEATLMSIGNGSARNKIVGIDTAIMKMLHRVEELRSKNEDITGIPSGFIDIDRVTFGWQNTDLIILAARPAVGKTAFALNLLRNAAMNYSIPVAFFSLEMSIQQLTERLTSAVTGIALENIRRGKIDGLEQQLYTFASRLAEAPIYLDDTPALNVFELRAKARRLKNKHNIGMIIIDYLQLMSGTGQKGQNREQEISNISRNLKALAKELNLPIIALSQLSRAVETRGGDKPKMPQLSDLRESGAIEQDADMVMFIYRPEYYNITSNEMGESNKGETHIKIAKHRNGSLEEIKLMTQLQFQKFLDWDDSFAAPVSRGEWRPTSSVRMPYKDDSADSPF